MGNDRATAARAGRRRAAPALRALSLGAGLLLAAAAGAGEGGATRVASMNLCTDSMLFELVDAERIVSVTRLSRDPNLSYFHRQAARVAVNRGEVEEIVHLAPDLVLTGPNSTALTARLLARLDVAVMHFEHANTFAAYRGNLLRLATRLDALPRARAVLARLQAVLDAKPTGAGRPRAIAYQPNGFTPGTGSLMHDILRYAGYRDVADELELEAGGFISLEALLLATPDLIVLSGRTGDAPSLAEAALEHPALERYLAADAGIAAPRRAVVAENLWTCAGAFSADAIAALRGAGP